MVWADEVDLSTRALTRRLDEGSNRGAALSGGGLSIVSHRGVEVWLDSNRYDRDRLARNGRAHSLVFFSSRFFSHWKPPRSKMMRQYQRKVMRRASSAPCTSRAAS